MGRQRLLAVRGAAGRTRGLVVGAVDNAAAQTKVAGNPSLI